MATRFTLEEVIEQIMNEDLDSGEFEDSTDESELDSDSSNEDSDRSGDEASSFVDDQEPESNDAGMYF